MTKKKQISCGAKSIVLTDEQMVDEINELLAKSDYNYNFGRKIWAGFSPTKTTRRKQ